MRFPGAATSTRSRGAWAVVVLVLVPVVAFGVPALAGHPTMPGDDLTQNFPLRVLAGEQISSGHLPVFDSYLWGGSPLLAGWNAGAVYPLTWLFAILPGTGAWTLNLIGTWAVAGLSTYFLCRGFRLAVLPSTLAAVSFAYAGEMSSQIVHFGLITGIAWLPLAVLAVRRVTEPASAAARRVWTGVLALAVGLVLLAGEPRAIDDGLLVIAVFAVWTVTRLREERVRAAVHVGVGAGLGVLVGALQWLPGAIAVSTSQRAASSAALFTSGSLPSKWLLLLLEPNLLGGTGSFGEPHFAGAYPLLEISGYVGIFPLVAAVALLARLRRGGGVPDWFVWHAVAFVGVLLALGGNTPLWHLFAHVPLFGGQRLQSRNLLVVDFALAVLFAYWADDVLSEPVLGREPAVAVDADSDWRRRARVVASAVPAAAVVAAVVALFWGAGLAQWLSHSTSPVAGGTALGRWQIPFLVVDVAALLWVWWRDRLSSTARATSLAVIVLADLGTFTVLSVAAVAASPQATPVLARTSVPPAGSSTVRPIASLGLPGRFAIYNPDQLAERDLAALGSPDVNLLTQTPSVQGYSAIVDGRYAADTGSHVALGNGQNTLKPAVLDNGVLDQLNDGLLVTLPQYLISSPGGGPDRTDPATRPDRTVTSPVTWFLGTSLQVDEVSLPDAATSSPAAGTPSESSLGLAGAAGTTWLVTTDVDGRLVGRAPRPVAATAVVLRWAGSPERVGAPTVSAGASGASGAYVVDGDLATSLSAPHWAYAGSDGPFSLFVNRRRSGPVGALPLDGQSLAGSSVRVRSEQAGDVTAVDVTSPHGLRVTRSVAAIPGWSATWTPSRGPAVSLAVQRAGVVQVVTVPPGRGLLAWRYRGPGVTTGLVLSGLGVVGVLVCLLAGWRSGSRRRRRRIPRV